MSNEWVLVDRLIAERDRLAEALREARKWVGIYCVPGTLKADMDAALAECAGTPTDDGDDAPSDLFPCGSCGTAFTPRCRRSAR